MKIYTKNGDRGMTTLMSSTQISKADERVAALGTIDELTSAIGLAKAMIKCEILRGKLERIQKNLITLMAGIAAPRNVKFVLDATEIEFLESQIDKMEDSFPRKKEFILPGGCELSARIDFARTVARRAERELISMDRKYAANSNTKTYLNRLADYLYILARRMDYDNETGEIVKITGVPNAKAPAITGTNAIIDEVVKQIGEGRLIDLRKATVLIEEIEKYAESIGKKAVIAICNSEGNPIAVHVMDGAFLVSYDVAVKKAYTAVSVKMPTMELSKLVQPGQTFYGLQNVDKMVVFGGGVPLKIGDKIVGGLGISGGTGEEDHALCEYGLRVFETL